jgi:hypothetical protein
MKQIRTLIKALAIGLGPLVATSCLAQVARPEAKEQLIKEIFTGKPTKFQDYLIQDAAAGVAAAELAGIAPSAVQVMENTRDFTLYVKGLSGDGSGGGFAITPARVKNPIPAITVEQYKTSAWARILAATTISYAQGTTDTDGKKYKRRALSIASNWYPFAEPNDDKTLSDDPVYQSIVSGENCLRSYGDDHGEAATKAAKSRTGDVSTADSAGGAPRPAAGKNTAKAGPDGRPVLVDPDYDTYDKTAGAYVKSCSAASRDAVAARWYRPIVSLSIGTGDVGLDNDGSSSVGMGNHATLALRYGRALNPDDERQASDSITGWALYLSNKTARNAPVVSTLGTSSIERTSISTTAARLSLGQSTWRALLEASDVKAKQASTGEQTLRKAIGLEYKLGQSAWLHVRYGKRLKATGTGEEAAGLLSVTFGPEALQF